MYFPEVKYLLDVSVLLIFGWSCKIAGVDLPCSSTSCIQTSPTTQHKSYRRPAFLKQKEAERPWSLQPLKLSPVACFLVCREALEDKRWKAVAEEVTDDPENSGTCKLVILMANHWWEKG